MAGTFSGCRPEELSSSARYRLRTRCKSGAFGGKMVQKAVQHGLASSRTTPQENEKTPVKTGAFQEPATQCDSSLESQVGVIGLEPMTPSVSSWCSSQLS